MALRTATTLDRHYSQLACSAERLSSGLRVNSAADDAAGLAIRELMRSDIAALYQGQRNANDAISLLQTADAALGIIDEKLIRMKELAEQAATGTYDSTQRLMIDSEFKAMAAEIDRIARATDFNGLKLLDGSLSGSHDGSKLSASGAMKIHFGSGNDSAEDYYYISIADCTTKGLGLRQSKKAAAVSPAAPAEPTTPPVVLPPGETMEYGKIIQGSNGIYLNDLEINGIDANVDDEIVRPWLHAYTWSQLMNKEGIWCATRREHSSSPNQGTYIDNCMVIYIPAGTTDIVINTFGCGQCPPGYEGDNDLQVFTRSGKHLVGTPLTDCVFTQETMTDFRSEQVAKRWPMLDNIRISGQVRTDNYDDSFLNTGPDAYDSMTLKYSTYNGMTFGYTGDPERQDSSPEDRALQDNHDYEILTIDVATEALIVALPGVAGASLKAYHGKLDVIPTEAPVRNPVKPDDPAEPLPPTVIIEDNTEPLSIETQEKAQKALVTLDKAIATKDHIRASLGALQNRLENTVANLSTQAVNLQASELRISDADVAVEMTLFVRYQILTQSATAMLGHANSYPNLLMKLLV